MDSHKVSLLKCTTASETLVMHRTTFLCLSLVPGTTTPIKPISKVAGLRGVGTWVGPVVPFCLCEALF